MVVSIGTFLNLRKIPTYKKQAHGVVVTAASKEGYASAPAMLRPGGTMVAVGLPKDPTVIAGAPPIMLALKKVGLTPSRRLKFDPS